MLSIRTNLESKIFLDSVGVDDALLAMWNREGIKGTSCPKKLMRIFIRRMYYKLLDLDTKLTHIPTCSKFQNTDWRKYEEKYGFTIVSKLIQE